MVSSLIQSRSQVQKLMVIIGPPNGTPGIYNDRPYTIYARSFDGIGYSQWDQIEFIADNPPNKNNNRPVFDNTGWEQEFILYCDAENLDLLDRCTFSTIDLNDHFSDPDIEQDIILAVVDDQHAIGIRIDSQESLPMILM